MTDVKELKSEELSFFQLLKEKKYCIEIPKVQRDYAQGRRNEKADEVREDFLNQLKDYLQPDKPRKNTLDFVYGNVTEDGKLILLDGQQRLTTLFLLHWFTALNANNYDVLKKTLLLQDEKSRFVYNTREFSNDFCVKILKNGNDVFEEWNKEKKESTKIKLSRIIKNQKWFFISYSNDLTIKSMLTMIDVIAEKFSDSEKYFGLLIDEENPAITFNFLPMSDNGLSDDLYIKMNSRGRELTRFENLKSKILSKLDENEFDKEKRNEFSEKIDTDWLDLFWKLKDEKNINHFDDTMLDFFEAVFIDEFILNSNDSEKNKTASKVKKFIENYGHIPFSEILSFASFNKYIEDIICILNKLTEKSDSRVELKTYFKDFDYYDEEKSFKNLINHSGKYKNESAYSERILFFAYCAYLVKNQNPNGEKFKHWMRIVRNLVENSIFDSENDFCNVLLSVNKLIEFCGGNDIYDSILSFEEKLTGIDENQLNEEKIKAFLITSSNEWKEDILSCEKQKYFCAQLSFALNYVGLWDILKKENEEREKLAESQKSKFDECIKKTFALFNDNGLRPEADKDARLIRALLVVSDGNYMMAQGSNWSFLINNHRDISWKNYLKDDSHKDYSGNPTRSYFRALIDDKLYNPDDLTSLEKLVDEHKEKCAQWVQCFASNHELLTGEGNSPIKIGNEKLIRDENDENEIYILSGERMSSYHSELFTAGKYLELKKAELDTTPFSSLEYYMVKNSDEEPCFYLNDWKYETFDFALDCIHKKSANDSYSLVFFDRNNRAKKSDEKYKLPPKIIDILESNGFNPTAESEFEYEKNITSKVGDKKLEKEITNILNALKLVEEASQKL